MSFNKLDSFSSKNVKEKYLHFDFSYKNSVYGNNSRTKQMLSTCLKSWSSLSWTGVRYPMILHNNNMPPGLFLIFMYSKYGVNVYLLDLTHPQFVRVQIFTNQTTVSLLWLVQKSEYMPSDYSLALRFDLRIFIENWDVHWWSSLYSLTVPVRLWARSTAGARSWISPRAGLQRPRRRTPQCTCCGVWTPEASSG